MSHYSSQNQSSTVAQWNNGTTIVAKPVSGRPGKEQLIAVQSPSRGGGAGAGAAPYQQGEHALAQRGNAPSRAIIERQQAQEEENSSISGTLARWAGIDNSHKYYWIPSEQLCEYGLCETIHRRTDENTNYLLVHTRPVQELGQNFSFPNGYPIDLNQDHFRLSKVAQTVKNLDGIIGDGATGAQVKDGVRDHLPGLTQNSFYLVCYRDYSPWAVKTYWKNAKKDSTWGKNYVIRHFAVRVGSGPGCFIPLSEAQCMLGWEKLVAAHLETPEGATGEPIQRTLPNGQVVVIPPRLALNSAEFDGMMGISGPTFYGDDDVRRQQRGAANGSDAAATQYPSAWDWTPSAIQKRWDIFVQNQYQRLGRAVFKMILIFGALAFTYYALRRSMRPSQVAPPQQQQQNNLSGRRLGRSLRRTQQQQQMMNNDGGYYHSDNEIPNTMFEALLSFSPKSVLDFVLAPRM